ncbi:F-box/RNI-like superfamily protein [Prunus dulcis]|uniref:F-box/RNI-like superfamily protein n=1 Tax=Prunus dulcis TaxID=3755 RepID=A0A4Y1RTH1_PRUDU|nr:F-box/RNI-like superfamily protein [Prunus dulcis]
MSTFETNHLLMENAHKSNSFPILEGESMVVLAFQHLPVEVIGNILSRLKAARDVVIASATCKKWREAWRNHLHTLSFNSNDWSVYHDLAPSRLEILITQTIFQTTALQCLSIFMDDVDEFSAAPVIAWLMYTRDTLRQLHYNVRTTRIRQKLEVLSLAHNSVTGVEPSYQKFPCLKSLSLSYVSISALDLSLLLTACPKLQNLTLINPDIAMSDAQAIMELNSSSLKDIYVEAVSLDKFILEADSIENLHLKDCTLEAFELIGKGSLRVLKIDDVSVLHLDIGENTENLQIVDVSSFTIMWPKFYNMISKSSNLKRLRLWGVVFDDEDEVVDLETVSVCFPRLSHLSLSYDLRDVCGLQGTSPLENVVVLELGWTIISDLFSDWVAGLLERCPNLKKLVICGVVSEVKSHEECQVLASFTSSIVRLMRKYMRVEVQFDVVTIWIIWIEAVYGTQYGYLPEYGSRGRFLINVEDDGVWPICDFGYFEIFFVLFVR